MVRDNGIGIVEEQLPQVFDKFFGTDQTQQGNFRSTGLGLTFCKMAVEKLGGAIGVNSKQGQGSTFWFTLPLVTKASQNKAGVTFTQDNLILQEAHKIKTALQGRTYRSFRLLPSRFVKKASTIPIQ